MHTSVFPTLELRTKKARHDAGSPQFGLLPDAKESADVQNVYGTQTFFGHYPSRFGQTSFDSSPGGGCQFVSSHSAEKGSVSSFSVGIPFCTENCQEFPKADNDATASKTIQAPLNYTKDSQALHFTMPVPKNFCSLFFEVQVLFR